MIGFITIGTNNLASAEVFFDVLLAQLGGKKLNKSERFIHWNTGKEGHGGAGLTVLQPLNGESAQPGNGITIALQARDIQQVKRAYNIAVKLGGQCEGQPGPHGNGLYAAFFRDLDGNKFNVYCQDQ
jgi:catechol 2,3-dioxygenase-like lactoylglutathione lyase family enzyme